MAGVGLGQIQNRARSAGAVDPITSSVRTVVQPIALPVGAVTNSGDDFVVGVFSGSASVEENRRLKSQLAALAVYSEQIADLQRQVDSLRTLQGYGAVPGKERVPATVIGLFPYENLATLNVGSDHGIAPGNPVISAGGLLGTILSVETNRSQMSVLSPTNRRLTIGAIDISRKPPPAGLLTRLSVTFQDPYAPIEVGDMIVTSGFSDKIPRGIHIGRVIFVEDIPEEGTKRAWIDPAVTIGDVQAVQVLK